MKDDFYNRHIIKHNLFQPMMELLISIGNRYNMVNSAIVDLFEFIRRENIKPLITYLVETFGDEMKGINYVDTFQTIITRYHQQHDVEEQETSNNGTTKKRKHGTTATTTSDHDEEDDEYFDEDEDDKSKNKKLVDYDDDDEEKKDTAATSTSASPSQSQKPESTPSLLLSNEFQPMKKKNDDDDVTASPTPLRKSKTIQFALHTSSSPSPSFEEKSNGDPAHSNKDVDAMPDDTTATSDKSDDDTKALKTATTKRSKVMTT